MTGENSGDTARSVKISKQTKLQLWSGERLMSRDLVVEMARAAVEESELREEERTKAERTEVTLEESPKVLPVVVEQPKHQRARRAKKVVNKQETRPRDIMTTKPQDIRDMVRRNKEKAKRIRQEKKEQEARDERKRRATEQRRQLLEDIKTKTEHAKQRLKKKTRERELQELEKEKRLRRAGVQRTQTLVEIHRMDWSETEMREEGQ